MDAIVVTLSASLSLLLPLTIICIRHTVKQQRQEIIRDLEQIFRLNPSRTPINLTANACEHELIVPSFEFVKFKYFIPRNDRSQRSLSPSAEEPHDIPLWAFVVSGLPLMLSLFILGVVSFGALLPPHTIPPGRIAYLPAFIVADPSPTEYTVWLSVLMVAYFGAYLYTIRMLLKAVSNFDLSPSTFLSATAHVLLGVITAVLFAVVAHRTLGPDYTPAALLIAAFAIGFVPDLGLRALLRDGIEPLQTRRHGSP